LSQVSANNKQVINYEVSYLGIPLLDMTLNWVEDDSSIFISYDNRLKPLIAFFLPIHNVYRVHFRKNSFRPIEWSRTISEGDLKFQFGGKLFEDERRGIFSNNQHFEFPQGGFTVFSATHFLASKAWEADFFPVKLPIFIDGQIWEARAQRFDKQHPHPHHKINGQEVMIQTDLHLVSGESVVPNNDILMSVIATEGTRFFLWVDPDKNYTRALFGTFPQSVVLEQVKN